VVMVMVTSFGATEYKAPSTWTKLRLGVFVRFDARFPRVWCKLWCNFSVIDGFVNLKPGLFRAFPSV
jgi:hypothetical protein